MKLSKLIYLAIVFSIAFLDTTRAQVQKDTLVAFRYFQKADSLLTDRKLDSAIVYFKKALFIYEKVKAWERVARCYNNLGVVDSKLKIYDKAIKNYKKSERILIENFGENHMLLAKVYIDLGDNYDDKGELGTALEFYKKVLKISKFNSDKIQLAKALGRIGGLYTDMRLLQKALDYQKKSLNVQIESLGINHPNIAITYNNMGRIYDRKEDYDKALEFYVKSLRIHLREFGEGHPKLIPGLHNIGIVYNKIDKYPEALEYYGKGLEIIIKNFGNNHEYTGHSYNNIAKTYADMGDYESAIEYYLKCQSIYEKIMKRNPRLPYSYSSLANVYRLKKDYELSLVFYEKSIKSNLSPYNTIKSDFFLENNSYFDLIELLRSITGKATVYKSMYQEKKDLKNLKQSIRIYQRADSLLNSIRQSFDNRNDKVIFAKKAKKVYSGAIETQLLFNDTEKGEKNVIKAFDYSEKSKANTLKELLSESTSKGFANIPEELLSIEKTIKTDRAFYQSQIIDEKSKEEVDSIKISSFENKLFDLNRKQDSLTQVLEKEYPKYHQLKYQDDIITVADIQKNLSAKTTLLEFFTADSITYAFIITKNKIEVQELSTPNILEKTKEFREAITSKDVRKYKRVGHLLYTTLIAPIQNKIVGNELIIVPDGPLWHLNFDLLLTQNTTSNNPKALPYFLRDYAITYANSANLVFTSFKTNTTNNTTPLEECLAFSFSDTTSTNVVDAKAMSMATLRGAKSDLPGTRREIQEISKIIDGQYYFGSEAIEANFKKKAGQYNILHLALHGEVDNDRPENSKLFFTKSKDTLEDNLLYAHELFALDIPAELTVLSACNTGSGKIAKGEGIMSLGTAFQYAGTKSLLLTSWEVPDQTTPEVMKYFYSNLKKGLNKGQALQQAKLEYLKTAKADLADPFYWGSFYLVGDSGAMHFNNITSWYWVFGIGILCILGYLIYRYKTRQT